MPPAVAPAPAPPAPAPPSPARTQFNFVVGDFSLRLEARWTVAHDSPLVLAFPFLPWSIQAPPARTTVPRSAMVAAILYGCGRPTEADHAAVRAQDFLTHEFISADASLIAHEYDKIQAFDHFECLLRSRRAQSDVARPLPVHELPIRMIN